MLDIGWSEFLVIGVVALVVVGPKDLPVMFRTLGRFTAKARSMSREFTRAMERAADEAGVKDVVKDLKKVTSPKSLGLDAMQNAASRFEKWDPLKPITAASQAKTQATNSVPKAADLVAQPAAPAVAETPSILGPNTAALAEKRKAARAKVPVPAAAGATAGESPAPADKITAKPAAKSRKVVAKVPMVDVVPPASKPRRTGVAKAAVEPAAAVKANPLGRPKKSDA